MARYHFNIVGVPGGIDEDGIDLPSFPYARRQAMRLVGELLEQGEFDGGDHVRLEVTDDAGLVLFRLDIAMVEMLHAA